MSQCQLEHTVGDMLTRVEMSGLMSTSDTRDDDTENTMGIQWHLP